MGWEGEASRSSPQGLPLSLKPHTTTSRKPPLIASAGLGLSLLGVPLTLTALSRTYMGALTPRAGSAAAILSPVHGDRVTDWLMPGWHGAGTHPVGHCQGGCGHLPAVRLGHSRYETLHFTDAQRPSPSPLWSDFCQIYFLSNCGPCVPSPSRGDRAVYLRFSGPHGSKEVDIAGTDCAWPWWPR